MLNVVDAGGAWRAIQCWMVDAFGRDYWDANNDFVGCWVYV